jgi:glycosyltransferase involved in cell wall biosynthesis
MKVLIITDLCRGYSVTLPERSLFRGLVSKGVDLQVMSLWETPETLEVEATGVKVHYLKMTKKIDFGIIRELRKILEREKFDILFLTFGKAITNTLIASRGIDVKIIGYIGSLNVHWHDPFAYLSFLNRRIEKMICLSDGVLEHLLKQSGSWMKERAVRVYKGYDPEWVKVTGNISKSDLNIPDNAMVVCCIANVRRVKGIPYLIRAANHITAGLPIYFILVGKGMDSPYLTWMVRRSKYRDNFRVFGFTNDIFSYTSLCDLYVQPSIAEGLGRSLIEAMCLAKPAIVTEKGGSKELVTDHINGYVVPSKSSEALAERIEFCYNNRNRLKDMGLKSLKRILEDFSPQRMVDGTYNVFKEVLKPRSKNKK